MNRPAVYSRAVWEDLLSAIISVGKDLNITLAADKAFGRLGGTAIGWDISLQGSEAISGRVGGDFIGFDCRLKSLRLKTN